MKCLHALTLVCLGSLCSSGLLYAEASQAGNAAKTIPSGLVHPNMKLIDAFFSQNPRIMISINMAARVAGNILCNVATMQQQEVADRVAQVLKPVEVFLGMLNGEVGAFVDPLVIESLGVEASAKSILGAMTRQKAPAADFLRISIKSKDDLAAFCKDFQKFSDDLHSGLSEATRKKINIERKALIAQAKSQRAAR